MYYFQEVVLTCFFWCSVSLAILLASCNGGDRKIDRVNVLNESTHHIKIKVDDYEAPFLWGDEIDSFEVVQLDNDAQALIGRVSKGEIHLGRLYLLDMLNSKLLVFNAETGDLISSVGRKGKGPGEYRDARDFTIAGDTLYLLDYLKVHKYALSDYNYLGSYKFKSTEIGEMNPIQFLYYSDDLFYLWNNGKYLADKNIGNYHLNLFKEGNLKRVYLPNKSEHESLDVNRFYHTYKGGYLMIPPEGEYNIVSIARDSIHDLVKLDFGNDSITVREFEAMMAKTDFMNLYLKDEHFKHIYNPILIDNDVLYFSCLGPGSYRYEGLLDLAADSVIRFGKHVNIFSPYILCSDQHNIYGYYDPARIAKYMTSKDQVSNTMFDNFRAKLGDFDANDNLVLVKFSIKSR